MQYTQDTTYRDTTYNQVTKKNTGEVSVNVANSRNTASQSDVIVPENTVVSEENFMQGNGLVVGIIIAEVAAVIIGIVLLVGLFVRKS